jgi:cold-inducible RNA-binding protein
MSNKLFVGNLSFNTTENDLQDAFAAHGTVTEANLMMDRTSGRPRGFGFVTMSTADEAQKAVEAMNGKSLDGRALTVNIARPREERSGGGGGGGGGGGRSQYGGRQNRYWFCGLIHRCPVRRTSILSFRTLSEFAGLPPSAPFAQDQFSWRNEPVKEQPIEVEGLVQTVLPGTMFRVELANKHLVLATICGKMRKRWVRLTVGDRVRMEMSPYDLDKARITWRLK